MPTRSGRAYLLDETSQLPPPVTTMAPSPRTARRAHLASRAWKRAQKASETSKISAKSEQRSNSDASHTPNQEPARKRLKTGKATTEAAPNSLHEKQAVQDGELRPGKARLDSAYLRQKLPDSVPVSSPAHSSWTRLAGALAAPSKQSDEAQHTGHNHVQHGPASAQVQNAEQRLRSQLSRSKVSRRGEGRQFAVEQSSPTPKSTRPKVREAQISPKVMFTMNEAKQALSVPGKSVPSSSSPTYNLATGVCLEFPVKKSYYLGSLGRYVKEPVSSQAKSKGYQSGYVFTFGRYRNKSMRQVPTTYLDNVIASAQLPNFLKCHPGLREALQLYAPNDPRLAGTMLTFDASPSQAAEVAKSSNGNFSNSAYQTQVESQPTQTQVNGSSMPTQVDYPPMPSHVYGSSLPMPMYGPPLTQKQVNDYAVQMQRHYPPVQARAYGPPMPMQTWGPPTQKQRND